MKGDLGKRGKIRNRRKDKRKFTNTAMKVHKENNPSTVMRGGIRM